MVIWADCLWWWITAHATVLAAVIGAFAAVAVAVFTYTLKNATGKLWAAADTQAKIAARTLTDLERPYIFIYGILFHNAVPGIGVSPYISYSVSNNGRLAARIENISVRCGFPRHNHAFPPPIIIGDHYFLQQPILGANTPPIVIVHSPLLQDQFEYTTPFRHPSDGLIFQVIITYRGPFTQGHETGQGWRYNKSANGFVEISDLTITYTR